jgi:uncharacterized protein YacL (UPF0231 family)
MMAATRKSTKTVNNQLGERLVGFTPVPQEDKLDKIRSLVRETMEQELVKADLEERLKEVSSKIHKSYTEILPSMMEEAGTDSVSLTADGNFPGATAQLKPYYRANIAAAWDEERKQAAYDWLDGHGHGDLVATLVTIQLPRDERAKLKKLTAALKPLRVAYEVRNSTNHNTLTAWLKEEIERNRSVLPLDTLGATVGKIVSVKARREK